MIEPILIAAAYLLGSLSSAIIVCRVMGLPDPRTEGSNNPGATNVLRLGGKKAAAVTLLGDMLKGFIPVFAANLLGIAPLYLAGIAAAVILGHLYPLFFSFRGGKGIATTMGALLGLGWQIGGGVILIWLFVSKALKISSVAGLASMALAPIIIWLFWPSPELIIMQVGVTLLLFWRHRENIQRLISGDEVRIKPTG
jgi:glycerol-3-phosphate acyltransferase PlsY